MSRANRRPAADRTAMVSARGRTRCNAAGEAPHGIWRVEGIETQRAIARANRRLAPSGLHKTMRRSNLAIRGEACSAHQNAAQ